MGQKMRGICDTCDQVSELFQLSDRTDLNCSECHTRIGTTVQLCQALSDIEGEGGDVSEAETELILAFAKMPHQFPAVLTVCHPSSPDRLR
jgi:hypothetical protein